MLNKYLLKTKLTLTFYRKFFPHHCAATNLCTDALAFCFLFMNFCFYLG
jgi:hypothetical protein